MNRPENEPEPTPDEHEALRAWFYMFSETRYEDASPEDIQARRDELVVYSSWPEAFASLLEDERIRLRIKDFDDFNFSDYSLKFRQRYQVYDLPSGAVAVFY